jgi:hypothetical protein
MPVYCLRCKDCQGRVEHFQLRVGLEAGLRCPCGGPMGRDWEAEVRPHPRRARRAWQWNGGEPLTLEHINREGEGPLTFRSAKELRAYCRKHELASGALL